MQSPAAALALVLILAGCAHHTPKPEGSTLAATNALLRLAEADQATAKAAAAKLAPGQFVFYKNESGEAVVVTCETRETFTVLMLDRAGELLQIRATAARDGDTVQLVQAAETEWATPYAKAHAHIIYEQITAELKDMPANTPVLVE